ncbi:MAG: putative bifunctional diguanylate cyclase/phosphodiesterase [Leptospirillia bacterium]
MAGIKKHSHFTLLWAIGGFAALIWLIEPLIDQAVVSGGLLDGDMVVPNPGDLWMRASLVLLFLLLGSYEQAMLARLQRSERKYHDLINRIPDVTWTAVADGAKVFLSPNFEHMLGASPEEVCEGGPTHWWDRIHPEDLEGVRDAFFSLFSHGRPYDVEYRVRHKRGDWLWVYDRAIATYGKKGKTYADGLLTDITESRRTREALHYASYFDALTGLPNRVLFHDRLVQALARARRHDQVVGIICIELTGLREINGTLGHEVGDVLLQDVAGRLQHLVREEDTLARWGGEDLMMILPDVREPKFAVHVTHKIIDAVDTVMDVNGTPLSVGASVGLSFFPGDGDDADSLTQYATAAMERSKGVGRNTYQLYTPDMQATATRRLRMEAGLRRALEQEEFVNHYQPQVDLESGLMTGMESLLRWCNPKMGLVPPLEFIPLAEDSGLMVPIGKWVFQDVCGQIRTWQDAGLPPVRTSVNLSPVQFSDPKLAEFIADTLVAKGVDPRWLELEITESSVMQEPERAMRVLEQFKEMGLSIAIDDFGTGYSSLSYLKRFPVDVLKIDRAFVMELPDNEDDAAIARTIISMAHSLRLRVIAEGVETRDQLAWLQAHRCDLIQGFLFDKPLPAGAMTERLAAREKGYGIGSGVATEAETGPFGEQTPKTP